MHTYITDYRFFTIIRIAVFAAIQAGIISTDVTAFDTAAALPHALMFELPELDIIRLTNHVQRHAA